MKKKKRELSMRVPIKSIIFQKTSQWKKNIFKKLKVICGFSIM